MGHELRFGIFEKILDLNQFLKLIESITLLVRIPISYIIDTNIIAESGVEDSDETAIVLSGRKGRGSETL